MEPTLKNAPNSDQEPPSDPPGANYLAEQIADARLALESTLDDLTLDLGKAADLRRWVRRYPWPALGSALVAGFTVAHVVKSKHGENAKTAESGSEEPAATPKKKVLPAAAAAVGWRSTMISGLFDILRLAVTQFINASVRQAGTSENATRKSGGPLHKGGHSAGESANQAGTWSHPDVAESKSSGASDV